MTCFLLIFIILEAWVVIGWIVAMFGGEEPTWWERLKNNMMEEMFWMIFFYTVMAVGIAKILSEAIELITFIYNSII